MKYFFIIFLFCISAALPIHVHAGAAGGGSTIAQQFVQIALEIPTKSATTLTAANTSKDMIKNVILDPIANALISSALEGSSNSILAWVSGGFGGADPLIIGDPESYINNKGLEAVKGVLDGIPTDSAYGDTVFNTLLSQYRGSSDVNASINELTKSNIPSLIQNNLCTDEKITSLSIGAVEDENGEYLPSDLAAKKTELWNYACVDDPSTNPQVAARLEDLNTQNSSIGGWDTWLAVTSGENAYTRSVKTSDLLAGKIAEVKQTQTNEIYNGAGPVSEKECLDFAKNPSEGTVASCLKWMTTTPGDQVGSSVSTAMNAGITRLTNITGDGSLTGMLQGFAVSAITSGIKKAFNASGGGTKYNLPITLPSDRPVVQDLADDPLRKTQNLQPMNKQLAFYLTTINRLSEIDGYYMTDLLAYEEKIAKLKDCAAASSLYTNRMSRIEILKVTLQEEQAKILEARVLIGETKTKIDASNSSQEQLAIFTEYLTAVDDNQLPTYETAGTREANYNENKYQVENDDALKQIQTTCGQQGSGGGSGGGDGNSGNN